MTMYLLPECGPVRQQIHGHLGLVGQESRSASMTWDGNSQMSQYETYWRYYQSPGEYRDRDHLRGRSTVGSALVHTSSRRL